MTLFAVLAALLLALALAWLLPPLLRRGPTPESTRAGANLAVLREQRAQIDAELAAGRLDAEQHRAGLAEIERRVLDEEAAAEAPVAAGRAGRTALVLGLGVPLLAAGLYAQLGEPGAVVPPAPAAAAPGMAASAAEVEALVAALAQRMEAQPGDPEGWRLLGRSYSAMERYEDAARAYARLIALAPPSAQDLADYADVLAVAQGNRAEGEPTRLIEQALTLDPNNLKALAIAGGAALQRGDAAAAAGYWRRAQSLAPPGSPFAEAMARSIENAAVSAAPADSGAAPAAAARALSGRVSVAPALAARVAPTDTVFVFARAAEGPRMPLAIRRFPASALPLDFTLDDATAMSPELKLSRVDRVVVGARISKSGDALPRSGDLLTQTEPLAPGRAGLELVIDRVQP